MKYRLIWSVILLAILALLVIAIEDNGNKTKPSTSTSDGIVLH